MLVVYVYDGNSHFLAIALQAFNKRMLACAVGLAYASLDKVAVNGVAESLFRNVDEDGCGGFLFFLWLLNEDCSQRI